MNYQWHIFLASLDPAKGSEQAGKRPVLVISREQINQILPVVNVIPLTSRKSAARCIYPNEVLLPTSVGWTKKGTGYFFSGSQSHFLEKWVQAPFRTAENEPVPISHMSP
jgi:mRNA interferase MazF